jgi:hypothetical protein
MEIHSSDRENNKSEKFRMTNARKVSEELSAPPRENPIKKFLDRGEKAG